MDNFSSFVNDPEKQAAQSDVGSEGEEINSILRNGEYHYSKSQIYYQLLFYYGKNEKLT